MPTILEKFKENKKKKTYQAAAVAHQPKFKISAIVG